MDVPDQIQAQVSATKSPNFAALPDCPPVAARWAEHQRFAGRDRKSAPVMLPSRGRDQDPDWNPSFTCFLWCCCSDTRSFASLARPPVILLKICCTRNFSLLQTLLPHGFDQLPHGDALAILCC